MNSWGGVEEGLCEQVTCTLKPEMTGVSCQKVISGRENSKTKAPEAGPSVVCKEQEEGQCGWREVSLV